MLFRSSQSTISIQKRVNRFKLLVHDGALNEIGECIPVVEELFPISQQIVQCAYYFDSGDINSVREMGLFCAEIPSKV